MTDTKEKKTEDKASTLTEGTSKEASNPAAPATPALPPVQAAAKRLERLLGGFSHNKTGDAGTTAAAAVLHSNPSKIVKRWLGTSSGTAAKATLSDLSKAASKLLDPEGPCATGRDLIANLSPEQDMEIEEESSGEKESLSYLVASAREVEAWLISLAIRLLWKDSKYAEALDLSNKGIQILSVHLEEAASATVGGAASSLYPLLARMYRYQSLVAESLNVEDEGEKRVTMVHAHRMACLRRDVDTQATLLNLMLRDLLNADQGEFFFSVFPFYSVQQLLDSEPANSYICDFYAICKF